MGLITIADNDTFSPLIKLWVINSSLMSFITKRYEIIVSANAIRPLQNKNMLVIVNAVKLRKLIVESMTCIFTGT